jgi:hypothetical protein
MGEGIKANTKARPVVPQKNNPLILVVKKEREERPETH